MTSDSQTGEARFPFSPSPFSERGIPDRPHLHDLPFAGINEARIPEGRQQDGSLGGYPISRPPDTIPNTRQLTSLRPRNRLSGLRLLPLASFAWGSRGPSPLPRTSPDHTLLWVTNGEMTLEFPREQRSLPSDSIQYIPSGTAFSAFPGNNAQGIAILLSPSILKGHTALFPNHPLAKSVTENATELTALIGELEIEAAQHALNVKALHQPLLALAMLLDNLEPMGQSQSLAVSDGNVLPPLAERFRLMASDQLETGCTVAEIAADLNISVALLDRACRETYEKRPIDVMNELRVQRATELLQHSNLSAAQIAQRLGYTSLTHFTRSFVTSTGRSPTAFRGHSD